MKFLGYSDDELRSHLGSGRFSVSYRIKGTESESFEKAKNICVEQTVEFPAQHIECDVIQQEILGRIETFTECRNGYRAMISYSDEIASDEFPQFLNVVFGNSSLIPDITVERIILSEHLMKWFSGPKFGISGLRERLNVYNRPLSFTALKPMGLPSRSLADEAYKCALGGIDLIKDDHGLANQSFSTYRERVKMCSEAVQRANQESGNKTAYIPNVSGSIDTIIDRIHFAEDCDAGGVMLSPGLVGFDALHYASKHSGIPVIYHPAFSGNYIDNGSGGFDCGCIVGQIPRIAGADVVVFPNYGGRFSFSEEQCRQISVMCSEDLENIKPIFPAPSGGMKPEKVDEMIDFYGKDVALLMGGGLFTSSPDLVENCRQFKNKLEST
jgi:ribulose-bisphosphate carboxylase large chain